MLKRQILLAFLITDEEVFSGINLKKILWTFAFANIPTFLYQCRKWSDCKPSSWQSFSFDVPRMAPVMAKQTLY